MVPATKTWGDFSQRIRFVLFFNGQRFWNILRLARFFLNPPTHATKKHIDFISPPADKAFSYQSLSKVNIDCFNIPPITAIAWRFPISILFTYSRRKKNTICLRRKLLEYPSEINNVKCGGLLLGDICGQVFRKHQSSTPCCAISLPTYRMAAVHLPFQIAHADLLCSYYSTHSQKKNLTSR